MAFEKAPAFQFYAKDFLTDGNVAGMSLQERGAYITLLCLCWQEQRLTTDEARLANMVGVPRALWRKLAPAVLRCFRSADGYITHPRLDAEREKQAAFRELSSKRGTAGASARWQKPMLQASFKHASSNACDMPDTMLGDGSPISDLQTPVQNPPTPLNRGARVTREHRKQAKDVLRIRFGRCQHEPACADHKACEAAIAREIAEKAS